MDILEIVQSIGIVGAIIFSLLVFVKDIRHSRIPLKMQLRHFSVVWHEDTWSIVVFHLDFVNDSSQTRIVNNVQVLTPLGVTYRQCPLEIDESLEVAICQLPTGEAVKIPISEVLPPLLEIPPHQPRYKMFALHLQVPEPSELAEILPRQFVFSAWKAGSDKPLATDSVMILLEKLRTVGHHTMPSH
jgi:hypothetical protein